MPVRKDSVWVFVFFGRDSPSKQTTYRQEGNVMNEQIERLSISVAAEKMNTTPLNVLMHIKRNLLQAVEEDGLWMIDCQSLEALLAKTGGGKDKDACASGCAKKHACSGGCS